MFSYNDSMSILSEKIASPLNTMIAKEGLQVTKSDLQSPKIIEKLAILCSESTDFTLSVFDNDGCTPLCYVEKWGDYSSFNRIRINFVDGVNDINQNPQIIKYNDTDNNIIIPSNLPKFIHKFVLAIVSEWL